MTPGHSEPALRTEFRDHWSDDAWEDLLAESAFFTPKEFLAADHHFRGRFDEFGQFNGEVSVFGDDPKSWDLAWPDAHGKETVCGPFRINIAYVQGNRQQSRLTPEEWTSIIAKLDRYSGLYIYRDGIRVLPYGNPDFDFLELERNRSKSASDYFFSYRRMFGVIELTRKANGELREKAGREGFATNEAYRQFRDILKAFFYRVAFDFFREGGNLSEPYYSRRAEFERLDKARKRRSRHVGEKRKKLARDLGEFFDRVGRQEPEESAGKIISRLEAETQTALNEQDPGAAAATLADAETKARAAIQELETSFEVHRPGGVGLSKAIARDARGYEIERDRLVEEVFQPLQGHVEEIMGRADESHRSAVTRRIRFERAIETATRDSMNLTTAERRASDEGRETCCGALPATGPRGPPCG